MLVTVITATYNSAETVGSACQSLREQAYQNLEHIVVDGGSQDATLSVVSRFAHHNMLIDSRSDLGIYDALNRGIRLASGDIIGFLHSDDFFPSDDVLASVVRAFKDPSIDACYGDLAYVSSTDRSKVIRRWRAGEFSRAELKFGWMPPHPTVYVRREILQAHLFNIDYSISADYDAMLRLFLNDKFRAVYLRKELVHMRLGGASNKNLKNLLIKIKEDWSVIRSHSIGGLGTLLAKNLRKIPQFFAG